MIVIMKLTGLHLCLECHLPVMIKEGTVDWEFLKNLWFRDNSILFSQIDHNRKQL